jgi:hypothetical protein
LSDETAAYLNSAELEQLWTSVLSSPCHGELDGEQDAWANLFAAIARRDAAGIVRLGTGLLALASKHSDADLAYLITVTAAGYVRLGDNAQAHALLMAQCPRLSHAGPFDLALRDLRALTDPP